MTVSSTTQKLIWGIFAARCALCRRKVVWESQANGRSLTGEIAHIVGAQHKAARGGVAFSGDRDSPDNLVLLCREHHKIVDDNEDEYSVDRLRQIRGEFLSWLETQLTIANRQTASIVSQYTYINCPRVDEFAGGLGLSIDSKRVHGNSHLSELGYELNYLMQSYREVLNNMLIDSIPLKNIDFLNEGYVGQIVSFDRLRFRNRNVPMIRPEGRATQFFGDLDRDPHIYHSSDAWRFVINIDLRWITTRTAYGLVRSSGAGTLFSGFARINAVDFDTSTMLATGLVIGLPQSILAMGHDGRETAAENVDMPISTTKGRTETT